VSGEPGIGKTRLLAALADHAQHDGTRVLIGHAYESVGGLPYAPVVEALRSYVRTADPDALRAQLGSDAPPLTLLVPELQDRFSDLPRGRADSWELDRARLFDAVVDLLFAASRAAAGGLLLVLEDLHSADAAHAVDRGSAAPVVSGADVPEFRRTRVSRAPTLAQILSDLRDEYPGARALGS